MVDEIGERHLAGENESDRPCEQAEQQQRSSEQLEYTGRGDEGEHRHLIEAWNREVEQFSCAVLDEHERCNDAEQAQDLVGPFRKILLPNRRLMTMLFFALMFVAQQRMHNCPARDKHSCAIRHNGLTN